MRIAESVSHQIFERNWQREATLLVEFVSVSLIIPNLNAIVFFNTLVEFEHEICSSNEAVTSLRFICDRVISLALVI